MRALAHGGARRSESSATEDIPTRAQWSVLRSIADHMTYDAKPVTIRTLIKRGWISPAHWDRRVTTTGMRALTRAEDHYGQP